jgi:hypothetical protein
MLIAIDVPFLRRPVARFVVRCERIVLRCFELWVRLRMGPMRHLRGVR